MKAMEVAVIFTAVLLGLAYLLAFIRLILRLWRLRRNTDAGNQEGAYVGAGAWDAADIALGEFGVSVKKKIRED